MKNYSLNIGPLFVLLMLVNVVIGECLSSIQEGNSTIPWPYQLHREFFLPTENPTSGRNSNISYYSIHTWLARGGNDYYGAEATLDVYGFNLHPGQESGATIWIISRGDGQESSLSGIQLGWNINPRFYKDSDTHFYTSWISGGTSGKGCTNMICPGFHKTSRSIEPGHVITPVSHIRGRKSYIKLRLFKEKSSGDWHVHFGANGDPQPVGYFPKSLIPGLMDKHLRITFGGYVSHEKSQPSPPMGSGYRVASGNAASFRSLKLIDADGNDLIVNTNLPPGDDAKGCYTPSSIESAQFFYGGPGCV